MAALVHVAGTCAISTDITGSLTLLGYSVNGVDIEEQDYMENIHGDEKGGDAGTPIDVLKHPDLHIVTMELSKWDDTVAGVISSRVNGGVAGSTSYGVLYRSDNKYCRLLLNAANFTRNYLIAIPRTPIRLGPTGSRSSRLRLVFECHDSTGVLWNTTTV